MGNYHPNDDIHVPDSPQDIFQGPEMLVLYVSYQNFPVKNDYFYPLFQPSSMNYLLKMDSKPL